MKRMVLNLQFPSHPVILDHTTKAALRMKGKPIVERAVGKTIYVGKRFTPNNTIIK